MKYFPKNLQYLRGKLNLNQGEMSDSIGFKRSTWNGYENSKSVPNLSDFIKICEYFDISESDLIHSDLENVHLKEKTTVFKNGDNVHLNVHPDVHLNQNTDHSVVQKTVSDGHFLLPKANIYDFSTAAAAGEAMILLHDDKYKQEADYFMPNLGAGIHIRCPIGGDSMHSTIKDGDKVIATLVTDIKEIRQGHIYAVIDKADGLVCKRIYWDGENTLELVSDNEIIKPYKLHLKDVSALFRVREVHTTDLRPYWEDIRKDMRSMRNEINDLKRKMK